MPERLLALDVGTTTAKAALFGPDGRLIAIERGRLATASPAPGLMEQDAQAVWRTVLRLARRVLARSGSGAADLAALGLATQRTSIVIWDKAHGTPLAPMVLWSDLRGRRRAAELRAAGFFVVAQQAAAKLEAALAAAPEAAALAAAGRLACGGLDSFLIYKLSGGAHLTDRSQAWPTGYLDPAALEWNRALLEHQGLAETILPHLVDTSGQLAATAKGLFGAAVPIAADVADQQGAFIAHATPAKASFGTAAVVDAAAGPAPILADPGLPPFVLTSARGVTRYCLEGMVLSAGAALDWLRRACRLGDPARFEALAASVPDTAGAAFLPALDGLGAPSPDPGRRGALVGLSSSVGAGHIARAALEGLSFRVREVVEAVERAAGPVGAAGVDGGLAASDSFLQIQADLLARPVRRHDPIEATAAGAALLAGQGVGLLGPTDAQGFLRYERTFEPRIGPDEAAERHLRWRALVMPAP